MRKLVSLVPCIVFALATFGQLSSLKGTIRDTTEKKSLPRSVISLLRTKDSVLVAFTRADAQGHFKLDGLNPAEYLLLVTYPKFADYADRLQLPPGVTDLGVLPLTPRSVLLQEVVIRNNRAINIKGDTTEFLADSFKVKEGATVEDLLKQIPGIQVNSKGEITAQGKRVDKVLVDGEEFFGADPTIATQNIAAKAVDKVQVFETKSEQDQLKGIGATADANKTINIKLKESAKKGYFGKAEAGSDFDRLLNGKLMFNRFRGNQKLSVYGTKSNTNTGSLGWEDQNKLGLDDNDYEYDEISGFFFSYGNSDNEFNDWTLRGLPKAYTAGGLYGNKWGEDKNKTNLSYLYNRLGTTNQTTTVSQTLLKDTTFFNNSRSSSQGLSQRHTATGKYEWKPDSLTTIKFNISGKYNLKDSYTESASDALDENRDSVNANQRTTDVGTTKKELDNVLNVKRLFRKKNRQLLATFRLGLVDENQETQLISRTRFYRNNLVDSTDLIDQLKRYAGSSTTIGSKITYNEPLNDKWNLVLEYGLNANQASSHRNSYDKDANAKYTNLNLLFSNNFDMDAVSNSGTITARYQGTKLRLAFGSGLAAIALHLHDLDLQSKTRYNFTRFSPQLQLGFRPQAQRNFGISYRGNTIQPSLTQLQPLRNNTDPLSIYVGNPDLKVGFNHNFGINFSDFKVLKGRYIFGNANFSILENAITNQSIVDEFGKTTYTPVNVNGNSNYFFWAAWNSGQGDKKMNIEIQPRGSGGRSVNFINGQKNTNSYAELEFTVRMRYSVNEKYNWSLGPNLGRNTSKSSLRPTADNNYWTYGGRADGYIRLFKNWELSSDVEATLRQKTSAFSQSANVILWNAELSRKFGKAKSLKLGFVAHDILNQNIGLNRVINSNFISEERYDRLAQYFLLNISWTFSQMPGKKD